MKKIILTFFVLFSFSVKAHSLQAETCANKSSEELAQDLITFVANGGTLGLGLSKCNNDLKKNLFKVNREIGDEQPRSLVINKNENVELLGNVSELQDEHGPMNVFKVQYRINKSNGARVSGEMTFTRIYGQDGVDIVGCGFIQTQPTVSFIREECLN